MKLKNLCFVFAITLSLSACVVVPTRIADLTLVSSKNYNINSNNFERGERVSGTDMPEGPEGVGIRLIKFEPNLKTAIDRTIEKHKCAVALSDVVISTYGEGGAYLVEGNLILDRSLDGCAK